MHRSSQDAPDQPGTGPRGHGDAPGEARVSGTPPTFPPELPLIVHAAPRFVVVDKPSWMLSVPGKGAEKQDCVASRIAARFPPPRARGPLIVHRLDMETSGLMVLGLDEDAQRDLSRQFEERIVEKQYTALLAAELISGTSDPLASADAGEISLPMRADLERRPIQIVDHAQGRAAVTRWRILAREPDRFRILFEPLTGRTHQLRVHAAAVGGLGRPIIGDGLYGGEPAERLMLHASRLSFLVPGTRTRVDFESRPPF